jgi:hypothetical protein
MHRRIALFLFSFALLSPLAAQLSLSPYSRYGLGELYTPGSTRNFAMGSIGIGAFDGTTINRINPASYADIRLTTLDINGFGIYSRQKSNLSSQTLGTGGFHNVSIAFSNKRSFGLVAGLAPYSSTGYNVRAQYELQTDTTTEAYAVNYTSDGGLNQFYLGAGFRFFRNFYAGVNLAMAFGTTTYTTTTDFSNPAYNSTNIYNRSQVRGFLPQVGVQYGDTLRIKATVDRIKLAKQDIKSVDAEDDLLDKEEADLNKANAKGIEWEKKNQAKADELKNEKDRLETRIENLSEDESVNKKEIGKLQDKQFRLEKKRKKLVREIKARTRAVNDARARIQARRSKLQTRREALELEIDEIKAGKRSATVERKKSYFIRVGTIFEPTATLKGNRLLAFDNTFVTDTLFMGEGSVKLPLKYGLGFTIGQPSRWTAGMDVSYQDWTNFSFFNDAGTFKSQLNLNAGGEWIPDLVSRKYRNRIAYRFGAYYKNTFLTIKDNAIPEYGVTLGMGLPIGFFNPVGANFSRLNIGLALGRRGTLQGDLLEETTLQLRLGVNLNDVWFIRRVVD